MSNAKQKPIVDCLADMKAIREAIIKHQEVIVGNRNQSALLLKVARNLEDAIYSLDCYRRLRGDTLESQTPVRTAINQVWTNAYPSGQATGVQVHPKRG